MRARRFSSHAPGFPAAFPVSATSLVPAPNSGDSGPPNQSPKNPASPETTHSSSAHGEWPLAQLAAARSPVFPCSSGF